MTHPFIAHPLIANDTPSHPCHIINRSLSHTIHPQILFQLIFILSFLPFPFTLLKTLLFLFLSFFSPLKLFLFFSFFLLPVGDDRCMHSPRDSTSVTQWYCRPLRIFNYVRYAISTGPRARTRARTRTGIEEKRDTQRSR